MARAIVAHLCRDGARPARLLAAVVRKEAFHSLHIAEINTAGQLHKYLALCPRLSLSSYGSTDPVVPSEDLTNLTYPDGSYDLVLTSETLEHVPDYRLALTEIRRILRPGGAHVFTVPIVVDQPLTRHRACSNDGQVIHLMPPTYHGASDLRWPDYLVFDEFGADFVQELQELGFGMAFW